MLQGESCDQESGKEVAVPKVMNDTLTKDLATFSKLSIMQILYNLDVSR